MSVPSPQTIVPFTIRDLTPYDIARSVTNLVNQETIPSIGARLVYRGIIKTEDIPNIRAYIGERQPTNARFNIRVVPSTKETEWLATRFRKDKFTTYIDCITRVITDREKMDQLISEFGGAVQNWFLQLDGLQFNVQGLPGDTPTPVKVFDSWAGELTPGFSQDGALRIARITFVCWVAVPYNPSVPMGPLTSC